jgi:lipopolysaccharide transport system permease protein
MSTTRTGTSRSNRRQLEAGGDPAAGAQTVAELPVIVIRASDTVRASLLRDVYRYRELLAFLVWRDVKVRYKQTLLGGAWAVLQPLLTMAIFSVVFGRLAGIPSDGIPYPLFVYAALVPWTYFSTAVAQSSSSLVDQEQLLTKVYFPRALMPSAPVVGGLLDLGIAFSLLVGLQLFYGVAPGPSLLLLPLFILLAVASALGIGLWLSALNVEFRDVRYVIPFLLQVLLFASPVAYSSSLVPERWRFLLGLNPMAGVIEGFRWSLFDLADPSLGLIAVSAASVLVLLVSGAVYFGRMERTFADRI